ncbi:MAG: tetratricopeptide repeat protein [Verrucomicrobiota bacterium]|jgi:tetratricopeptide (TPR) repeat protein
MSLLSPLTDLQRGNRCLVSKDYERAIEHFLRHAQACPQERATAYVQIAECFRRSNIITSPVPVSAGVKLVSAGDRSTAEYYYRLALQADPADFGALRGLAEVLPDDSDERLAALEQAVSSQPNYLVLLSIGDFYRSHRKDFLRAYESYRRAQEQSPRDETAYRRLNDICRRLGRPDEAAEWSDRWRRTKATKKRVDGKAI